MVRKIDAVGALLNTLFKYSACLFLALIIFSCFVQVFTRYVMNNSLAWTEEMARYSFVWMSMLASSVAVRSGNHAAVNILENKLPGRAKAVHRVIIHLFIVVGAAFMITQGMKMMGAVSGKPSTVLRIPMQYIYMAIPVGGFGILVQAVDKILTAFRPAEKKGES